MSLEKCTIERLEAFEERYSVRLDNIAIQFVRELGWYDGPIDYKEYNALFEVYSTSSEGNISEDLQIMAVIYDVEGKIIYKSGWLDGNIYKEEFWGFTPVKIAIRLCNYFADRASKIRLYPKIQG